MRLENPSSAQIAFREEVLALLKKHAGHLPAHEMLAVSAHIVGQIIAFQDQITMSPAMAMDLVSRNIEQGNAEAIAGLQKTRGSA